MTLSNEAEGFVAVPVSKIEEELARQFKAEQDVDGPPIQWARLSNLVVFTDQPAQVETVMAAMPSIIQGHPARTIVVEAAGGSSQETGSVTASVRLRARHVQDKQEIASEQIYLRGEGRGIERLAFVVRGLLLGDVPTNLWWASTEPPPLAGSFLFELAEHADQVIYDSHGWVQPAQGLRATASWLDKFERQTGHGSRRRIASDLSWRRLKNWRRLIAQALDPAVAPGALETLKEIEIDHGPHSVIGAMSLASWIAQALRWTIVGIKAQAGVQLECQLSAADGKSRHIVIRRIAEAPAGLRQVRLGCSIEGVSTTLVVATRDDERRLAVVIEGSNAAPRTVTNPALPVSELIGSQISDRERDPFFHSTMNYAHSLARYLLGG